MHNVSFASAHTVFSITQIKIIANIAIPLNLLVLRMILPPFLLYHYKKQNHFDKYRQK